jgi:hypothetical protein
MKSMMNIKAIGYLIGQTITHINMYVYEPVTSFPSQEKCRPDISNTQLRTKQLYPWHYFRSTIETISVAKTT